MAQTGFTPISIYYSSTATNVPTAGNLVAGELAINTADGKLFYKDSAGVVQVIGTKGGVGSSTTTQVLYNSSGLVVGSANMTFNGTGLTLANDASISGLTVGKGGGAVASNTVLGSGALATATGTSVLTTAIGINALNLNTAGTRTVAVGAYALSLNTTGDHNVAVGATSLQSNTTGSYNVAMGRDALNANTTASNNTAVGYQSLYANTTGDTLTAVGRIALKNNTTGYNSTAIGAAAATNSTTGNYLTAIGDSALNNNSTGSSNIAVGSSALYSNTTASYNTAVGYQAGYSITTGSYNTCLGIYSGAGSVGLTTGSQNVLIGYGASTSAAGDNTEICITTNSISGKGTSTGFINPNSGGVYQGNNSTLWSITSDQRLKKNIVDNFDGLNKITAIQVRNFEYRSADEVTELEPQNAIDIKGVQLGAIAQELQAILPDCVKTESTGVMSVDASNITWYLVNAIKELKAEIDQLKGNK